MLPGTSHTSEPEIARLRVQEGRNTWARWFPRKDSVIGGACMKTCGAVCRPILWARTHASLIAGDRTLTPPTSPAPIQGSGGRCRPRRKIKTIGNQMIGRSQQRETAVLHPAVGLVFSSVRCDAMQPFKSKKRLDTHVLQRG